MHESSLSPDTSPEAERVYFDVLRRLGGERRLKMALEMGDTMHAVLTAGVRARHPDYTDEQVRLAVIRLKLGEKLFAEAFPGARIEP